MIHNGISRVFLDVKFMLHALLDFRCWVCIWLDVDFLIEPYNALVCDTDFLNTSMH